MELVLPSIRFGTFNPNQVATEPTRSLTRHLLDTNIANGLLPGLSYALDYDDYLARIGYLPTFNDNNSPHLFEGRGNQAYPILTGTVIKASQRTSYMNSIFSTSARQFYDSRPDLVIPEFIISPNPLSSPMNIPVSGLFDLIDYDEFPLTTTIEANPNQGRNAFQLGDKVIYFQGAPSWTTYQTTSGLSLIPVWDTVTDAEKNLAPNKYQPSTTTTSTPSTDASTILSLLFRMTTNSSLRSKVLSTLSGQDLTSPALLAKLLSLNL